MRDEKTMTISQAREVFKDNIKDIKKVGDNFDEYFSYCQQLRDDVDAVLDKTFGIQVKEKEIIRRTLHAWVDHTIQGAEKIYRSYQHVINTPKKVSGMVTDSDIASAKSVPMDSLIEFKNGFASCIHPNHPVDKTPSMKYYTKQNEVHCFGCGWHSDTIGVFQVKHNTDFISAVKELNNGNY